MIPLDTVGTIVIGFVAGIVLAVFIFGPLLVFLFGVPWRRK